MNRETRRHLLPASWLRLSPDSLAVGYGLNNWGLKCLVSPAAVGEERVDLAAGVNNTRQAPFPGNMSRLGNLAL